MRIRSILVAGIMLGGAVAPAAAWAQEAELPEDIAELVEAAEEDSDLGEEELHCLGEQLQHLREGAPVDTCEESPNPILPATNEIIWGAIAFLVVFVLLWRLAFPAIQKGVKAREERIRGDLEAAESARTEGERVLEEYRRQLADARNEAARIIDEARQAADGMRRDVQESVEAESAAARERAHAEIDQTVSRARADLERQVADFAVTLAERIVERNLDRDAQQQLIDSYIEEVGAMRGNGNGARRGGSAGGD